MKRLTVQTNSLYEWANKHGVSWEAVKELQINMGTLPLLEPKAINDKPSSEAHATALVRLRVAKQGGLLFRNNVGAMQDDDGRVVRYGLANESKQMNKVIKSSDLIGLQPLLITSDMIGQTIGQFVAIEMKAPGWQYSGTEREAAQKKFLELIIAKGGCGKFSNGS